MDKSEFPFTEKIRIKGDEWIQADAEARRAKDYADTLLYELINQAPDGPATMKNAWARSHEDLTKAKTEARDARTKANVLKGELSVLKTAFNEWKAKSYEKTEELRNLRYQK